MSSITQFCLGLLIALCCGYFCVDEVFLQAQGSNAADLAQLPQEKNDVINSKAGAALLNIQLYPPPPANVSSDHAHGTATIPLEFRLSTLKRPKPRLGQQLVHYREYATSPRSQCAGDYYDSFMKNAAEMVQQRLQVESGQNLWGRRATIVPPQTQKVLILGNSHTRQVALSLEWQYQDHILSYGWTDPHVLVLSFWTTTKDPTSNGVTIYIVHNHVAVHSSRWQQNMEQIVGCPLQELDAIVLGPFNPYRPKKGSAETTTQMKTYAQDHPEQEIDLKYYPMGFGLQDLIHAYDGPIISVSSFAKRHSALYKHNLQIAQDFAASRTNIRLINARAPIDAIGGGECGHEGKGLVADCDPNLSESNRCMGDKGGIPDFVAWDLIEALYDVLPTAPAQQKPTSSSTSSKDELLLESVVEGLEPGITF